MGIHYKDSTKPDAMAMSLSICRDSLSKEVTEIVNMTEPLVKVLRIMDGDKPPMGYVYEGMDRAKEAIKASYKGVHLHISLYGILLIPGGTGNYIHHCMQHGHTQSEHIL